MLGLRAFLINDLPPPLIEEFYCLTVVEFICLWWFEFVLMLFFLTMESIMALFWIMAPCPLNPPGPFAFLTLLGIPVFKTLVTVWFPCLLLLVVEFGNILWFWFAMKSRVFFSWRSDGFFTLVGEKFDFILIDICCCPLRLSRPLLLSRFVFSWFCLLVISCLRNLRAPLLDPTELTMFLFTKLRLEGFVYPLAYFGVICRLGSYEDWSFMCMNSP